MKLICATFTLIFLSLGTIRAQDPYIEGPESVCTGDCFNYSLVDFPFGMESIGWVVTDQFGSNVFFTEVNDTTINICYEFEGNYQVYVVYADTIDPVMQVDTVDVVVYGAFLQLFVDDRCRDLNEGGSGRNCQYVCQGLVTSVFAETSYQDSIYWEVSGGVVVENLGYEIRILWEQAGQGTVTAYGNASNCHILETICVQVLPEADAAIGSDPTVAAGVIDLCRGQPVYFEDLSDNAVNQYWNFGDGAFSDESDPVHSFDQSGEYTVTLEVDNGCECLDIDTVLVRVSESISPPVECIATTCPDEVSTYYTSADCATFHWTVSGGGEIVDGGGLADDQISVLWSAGPVGTVSLFVEDCTDDYCSEPAVYRVPVISQDGPILGDDRVCQDEVRSYTIEKFSGLAYEWTVSLGGTILDGQGSNRVEVLWTGPITPGQDEWVEVTYDHCYLGCGGSDSLEVAILPNIRLSGPDRICGGNSGMYELALAGDPSVTVPADWSLQDESGTLLWGATGAAIVNVLFPDQAGTYRLLAVPVPAGDYCQDAAEVVVTVLQRPDPVDSIAGQTVICTGIPYTFAATGTIPGAEVAWEVQDGGSMHSYTGQSITHTFTNLPPYEVRAYNRSLFSSGCRSDAQILSLSPVSAGAIEGSALVCLDETVAYTTAGNPAADHEWSIIPATAGTVVSGQSSSGVEVSWQQAGTHTLRLGVCGATVDLRVEVREAESPLLDLPGGLCAGETGSVRVLNMFSSYRWQDTDGNQLGTSDSVTVGPGTYELEVTDSVGCRAVARFAIDPLSVPQAFISTPDDKGFCAGDPPVTLYANTNGISYTYQWYRDGLPVGSDMPTLQTDDYGIYHVIVTSSQGCSSQSNELELFEYCIGTGHPNGQAVDLPAIECPPENSLDFLVIDGAQCNEKTFVSNSPEAIDSTFRWFVERPDLGLFEEFNEVSPSYVFPTAGYYSVLFAALVPAVNDPDFLCLIYVNKVVEVPVAADFSTQAACAGSAAVFTDLSTFLPGQSISQWQWEFGDPASGGDNTSTLQNPQHVYASPGQYTVQLTVTAASGCISRIAKTIEVLPPPPISIVAPAEYCVGEPVLFSGPTDLLDPAWDFDDPTSGSLNSAASIEAWHTFQSTGEYFVTLSGEDGFGCSSSAVHAIQIVPPSLSGEIQVQGDEPYCDGEEVELIASPGGISWEWSTGEAGENIAVHTAGIYGVTITDPAGCRYIPDAVEVQMEPNPVAWITATSYDEDEQEVGSSDSELHLCEGESVVVSSAASAGVQYIWNTGETEAVLEFPGTGPGRLSIGSHTFTLSVLDPMTQCTTRSNTLMVVVHEKPSFFFIEADRPGILCEGETVSLSVNNPDPGLTYEWSNGETGSSIQVDRAGRYYAIAINQEGCSRESFPIEIEKAPDASLVPSGCFTRCRPDTICLPLIPEAASYQWYRDGNPIPGPDGQSPQLVVTEDGSYTVELTSSLGCVSRSEPLDLELYDGFGHLFGTVYVDVDGDGMISPADTTMSGVAVELEQDGSILSTRLTNELGQSGFVDLPAEEYIFSLASGTPPPGFETVIGSDSVGIIGCDLDWTASLLLRRVCIPDMTEIDTSICEGDTLYAEGNAMYADSVYTFAYTNEDGCDSLVVYRLGLDPQTHDIEVSVYFDQNGDGTVDSGDSPLPDIPLILDRFGAMIYFGNTDAAGMFVFEDMPSGPLAVLVDTVQLPDSFSLTNGYILLDPTGCSNSYVVTFLLSGSCTPDYLESEIRLCPGDSAYIENQYESEAGRYEFTYINREGCDSTLVYEIIETDMISVSAEIDSTCAGQSNGSVSLSFAGGKPPYTVDWPDLGVSGPEVGGLDSGEYNFVVRDSISCELDLWVRVGRYDTADYTLELQPPLCADDNGSVLIQADAGSSWSLDGSPFGMEMPDDLDPGTYSLSIMDANGCVYDESVEILPGSSPVIVLPPQLVLELGESWTITHNLVDSTNYSFSWSPAEGLSCADCPAPTLTAMGDQSYTVTVTDENGCTATGVLSIQVDTDARLYIPSAFSPNGDGINDRFELYFPPGTLTIEEFMIFNRWGDKVYESVQATSNPNDISWDGTQSGKELNPGVFVYHVRWRMIDGTISSASGDITLVR